MIHRALGVLLLAMYLGLSSCGPVYTGLEGISRMMPEDKVMKCPYCRKEIAQEDRKCPYCTRDVQFDLGTDAVDKETRLLSEPPHKSL
jgi:hypothetical protein